MQLLYQPGKDLYILFTRWGRIGDRGQQQTTPFQTEADGIKNFCSIFKSKTGNAWTNIKSFEERPNKYHLVDASWNKKPEKKTAVDIKLDYTVACQLPSNIQSFVKQIVESKARKIGPYSTSRPIDRDMFAFGKINEAVLKTALEILHKIGQVLKQEEDYRCDNTELDHTKLKIFYNELSELNSEYFRKTPRTQFAFDKMSPITCISDFNRELSMIRNLLNMERAAKILLGAMYNHKDVNPMDYVYKTLGCKMRLLDEDNYMSQYILCCMSSDDKSQSAKVQGIYEISRDGEEERLKSKNKDNRMLLWHGTNEANFIGILHRGLLYNPTDNHTVHGQLYGEGIYFADEFHKSRRYSSSSSDVKLILLAEVALGKQLKLKDMNELKGANKRYDSLFVPGKNHPDPRGKIILPTGVTMCVGDDIYDSVDEEDGESLYAQYNEYIVFNEDQICLRYVIAYN
ncbi:poly [ADP-ribose] polymerase 1 [Patella vulgata]|uniref:poly [ADP-ribose] polymerase 1 n=1 Tax=Patella vulgata TaxID=6465 RepID=UPI00218039CB|nr:poly [ADP-ribose] polymerase 1 [Patella vulgata]